MPRFVTRHAQLEAFAKEAVLPADELKIDRVRIRENAESIPRLR
jgi:hypothetical protein